MKKLSTELAQAYAKAIYWVFLPHAVLLFKAWRDEPALSGLHRLHGATCSAVISASNPYSQTVSDAANAAANRRFLAEVEKRWPVYRAEGADPGRKRKAEKSFLIIGISLDDAVALGKRYKQFAIVYTQDKKAGTIPCLVACDPVNQPTLDATML